jgi:two-component system response regulator (stage 0 sporulation protein F)
MTEEAVASRRGSREGLPRVILLAEDDVAFRQLLATVLRQDGYEVIEAGDAGELVAYMARSLSGSGAVARPDLVITDVRMPGMSGLDAMTALQHARYASPFIVITGFGSAETHAAARVAGAVAVFDKPLDIDDLRRAVARQLRAA